MTASLPWVSPTVMKAMQALDRNGATITLADVKAETQLTGLQITTAAARMVKQGLLAQVFYSDKIQKHTPRRGLWTLTESGQRCDADALKSGPKGGVMGKQRRPHRAPNLREKFWNLIRCRQKLSIPEALEVLLTPGDDVKRATNNLQKYIAALKRGGYVQRLKSKSPGTSPTSNGHYRWLLIDDTGRIPPTPSTKGGTIYDHNTRSMRP